MGKADSSCDKEERWLRIRRSLQEKGLYVELATYVKRTGLQS